MAKIDKLKTQADMIKGYIFFCLGFMLMIGTGMAKLYMQVEANGMNRMIAIGFIILLIFFKISAIVLYKYITLQNKKLEELLQCKGE